MRLSENPRSENACSWRSVGPVAFLAWALAVLVAYVWAREEAFLPFQGFLRTTALAALSMWLFWGSGRRLLGRFFEDDWDPLERSVLEFALGTGLVCMLLMGMGIARLYHPWAAVALFIGLAVVAGDPRAMVHDLVHRFQALKGSSPSSAISRPLVVILAVVASMTFLQSLAPASSQDALVYHLAVPDIYVREGGLVYVPGNVYASYPQNAEMLFTLALLVGDSSLANWYHWMMGLGAAAAIAAVARRVGGGRGGLLASAVFVTMPSVALIATWAYADLGLIFFQMAAVIAFLMWWRQTTNAPLVLSGLFAGLAAGCKYTGGAIGIVLAVAIFVQGSIRGTALSTRMRRIVFFSLATIAPVLPWYIKNCVLTGNPLYPFLYGVFGGPDWDAERAATMSVYFNHFGGDASLSGLLKLPWRLTFESEFSSMENFDGIIGPAFLLGLPVMFLALRRSAMACLLFGFTVAMALFWLCLTRQIRFLLPALALASALLGAGLHLALPERISRWSRALVYAALLMNTLFIAARFVTHNPLPVVFGFEGKDRYLSREIACGDYPVFVHMDRTLPADARVFIAASGSPGYLCKRPYYMDTFFENHTLREILRESSGPAAVREQFARRGFTHLLFRWDLVFDHDGLSSGLDRVEQKLLASFLNHDGELLISLNGTFLYAIAQSDAGSEEP